LCYLLLNIYCGQEFVASFWVQFNQLIWQWHSNQKGQSIFFQKMLLGYNFSGLFHPKASSTRSPCSWFYSLRCKQENWQIIWTSIANLGTRKNELILETKQRKQFFPCPPQPISISAPHLRFLPQCSWMRSGQVAILVSWSLEGFRLSTFFSFRETVLRSKTRTT
jgi:hypothetical protein